LSNPEVRYTVKEFLVNPESNIEQMHSLGAAMYEVLQPGDQKAGSLLKRSRARSPARSDDKCLEALSCSGMRAVLKPA